MAAAAPNSAISTTNSSSSPSASGSLQYPPGRQPDLPEDSEAERERRQNELAGDEALALELAETLRLMSPAEPDGGGVGSSATAGAVNTLPRIGDGGDGNAGGSSSSTAYGEDGHGVATSSGGGASGGEYAERSGVSADDSYGVEYHALESDSEGPYGERRVGGGAQEICKVLNNFLRVTIDSLRGRSEAEARSQMTQQRIDRLWRSSY